MLAFPYMNTGKHINMHINTFSKCIHTATTTDKEKYRYKFTQTVREYQHTETFVHVNTNTYTYMLLPTATQTHKHFQRTQLHTVVPVHRSRTMNLHCGVAKKGSEKWGYLGDFSQRSDSHPVLGPGRGKAAVL